MRLISIILMVGYGRIKAILIFLLQSGAIVDKTCNVSRMPTYS